METRPSCCHPVHERGPLRRLASLFAMMSLLLGLLSQPVQAQEAKKEGTVFTVPAGSKLRATLGEAKIEATVENRPQLLEIRYGRLEDGRFVPYSPQKPMPYDWPFVVQLRYASEPPYELTTITVNGHHKQAAYKTKANPAIFQTPEMVFKDPSVCCSEP